MKVLVIAEHDGSQVRKTSRSAMAFAREIAGLEGGNIEWLLLGHDLDTAADEAATYAKVAVADDTRLEYPLADRYAAVIAHHAKAGGFDIVVAAASGWAKDIVGRAAGLMAAAMAGDVVAHEDVDGQLQLMRPMFAGEMIARVILHGPLKVITVRPSAYPPAESSNHERCAISAIDLQVVDLPMATEFLGVQSKQGGRPDATEADIVVSGGRAFRSTEDFESKVGALADRLGAAVGATRALVDEGLVPNEWQVGQTGKIVAPNLYLALGLSGAIQHLAGITSSKVIAAVNRDPEAPIFSVANYGLVGDVHEVVPKLIKALGPTE